jgi:predicted component of type VI protein secretion system
MLAIILLNNALLPDETLTAAKLELIRIAEYRQVSSPSSKEDVTNEDIAELRQAISSLDKRVSSDYNKIAKDADSNDLEVTLRSTLRKVHSVLNRAKSTLGSLSTQRSFIIRPSPYSDLVGQRL